MSKRKTAGRPHGPGRKPGPYHIGEERRTPRARFGSAMSTILAAIQHLGRLNVAPDDDLRSHFTPRQLKVIDKARGKLSIGAGSSSRIWRTNAEARRRMAAAEAKRARRQLRNLALLPWVDDGAPMADHHVTFRCPSDHVVVTDPERTGYPDLVVEVPEILIATLGHRYACANVALFGSEAQAEIPPAG